MFEISKIRARRIKNIIIYSLAIYGAFCLYDGCSQSRGETTSINPMNYINSVVQPEIKEEYKTLEKKLKS